MEFEKIHIGKLIQDFVRQNHINSAELARRIGKTRQNVYDLYKRDDIEVKLFLAISKALNHDFYSDICPKKEVEATVSIDTIFDALKDLVRERFLNKSE
jgi:hypothetical protein